MSAWIDGVAASTVLLALGLGATALLGRRSAALRHWILATAILLAAAMPLAVRLVPAWPLPITALGALGTAWAPGAARTSLGGVPGASLKATQPGDPAGARDSATGPLAKAGPFVIALWLAGVGVALGSLTLALRRLAHITRAARVVDDGPLYRIGAEVSRACGLRQAAQILLGPHPALVITWGLRRPRVLFPASAQTWDEERLRVVLRHELAHVVRADWGLQMAGAVACAIWWFSPLMWIACRRMRFESELASDDMVLASGVDRADYAAHLLDVAREATARDLRWMPATPIAHTSTLEGRIHAMLNTTLDRTPVTGRLRVLSATIAVALACLVAGGRITGQPLVAAAAQSGPGAVSGALYDQFGGLLPGAQVSLTHIPTGGRYDTTTDRQGAFVFRDLPPGDYELTTRLPGFQTVVSTFAVRASDLVRRNISLPLGTIEEIIQVTPDPAPARDTGRAAEPARVKPVRVIPTPKVGGPCTGEIGGCIKAPRKVWHASPQYPSHLAASGIDGVVGITGRIGIDGYLADLRVRDDASVDSAFKAAALEAVKQWEFDPTLLNGAPVATDITVNVSFSVK